MKSYRIRRTDRGLHIHLPADDRSQPAMLLALVECRSGHCSCPTPEYYKLAGIQVTAASGSVEVDLEVKPGAAIDQAKIEKCLDYTVARFSDLPD